MSNRNIIISHGCESLHIISNYFFSSSTATIQSIHMITLTFVSPSWQRGTVDISGVGTRLAEDAGGAINQYDIDIYMGKGNAWQTDPICNNSNRTAGQELLYNETKPHFGEGDKGNNKIINSEGHIYYESPSNVLILGGPNIDSERKQIAFFEADLSSETINLVLANKDSNVNKLQGINKIKWSGSIGKIEWKTNELITIPSRYKLIDYNIEQQTVTNEIDTPEKIKLDKENQEKIDRAILK